MVKVVVVVEYIYYLYDVVFFIYKNWQFVEIVEILVELKVKCCGGQESYNLVWCNRIGKNIDSYKVCC